MNIRRWFDHSILQELTTLPNLLTCFRFVAVPFLLWLAWSDYKTLFSVLLATTFLTDVLDGYFARKYQLESQLGGKLDTLADGVIYATMTLSGYWLVPELFHQELNFVVTAVISFICPSMVALIKFGYITSYHTWLVKFAAFLSDCGVLIAFAFGTTLLFRIGAILCALAAFEQILISLIIQKPLTNMKSIWHVLQNKHLGE